MDKLTVNLHSFVDVITNSSTVIYTGVQENAIDAMKGIINEVLRAAGSEKTSDDLFDISVSNKNEEFAKVVRDNFATDEEYYGAQDAAYEIEYPKQVDADYFSMMDASVTVKSVITVKSKNDNPQTTRISDLLAKIFEVGEDYC